MSAPTSQRPNVPTSQRSNVPTFQRSNAHTFQRSSVPTSPRPNVPTFKRSNVQTFQRSSVPTLTNLAIRVISCTQIRYRMPVDMALAPLAGLAAGAAVDLFEKHEQEE